jgi:glycosyltransferase involved in cell wall biosynthesis
MSGIGRYTKHVLEHLDQALPEANFVLYARQPIDFQLPSLRWSVRQDCHPVFRRLPTAAWIHFRLGVLARVDKLDVFWAANTLLPELPPAVSCVTTVYDLNHLVFPETMSLLTRTAHRRWFAADVLRAKRVVSISEGTSHRLASTFGRWSDAIARPAVPLRGARPALEDALQRLRQVGVSPPFLLTVGTREPRKNLDSAIVAVAMLKHSGLLEHHRLVMVGAKGWGGASRSEAVRAAGDWIQPLGYLDDSTLAALYSLADAFIFPSLYEGYGIPVGEALAFGCRVVTTDSPELREVGGNQAIYVEPTPAEIANGLNKALAMPAPEPRLPSHDWKQAAAVMAEVFRDVLVARG